MSLNRAEALRTADVLPIWTAPDMSILSAGRREPPAMTHELFGPAWPLLQDLAQGAGAPVDYVALGFLTVAASIIGGKRKARPFATSDWSEPAILWSCLVGDPSANKSPAIDAATLPLRAIEKDCAAEHSAALMRWEEDSERAKCERAAWMDKVKEATSNGLGTPEMPKTSVAPTVPERRRLMVMDATPEALGSILSGNPAGTLTVRDELSAWLTTFDRYSPGGRPFWLEAYGGRAYVVDRKSSAREGPVTLDFLGVSILGGIQPQKLAEALLDAADDGLAARFLWAWPDPIPYRRPQKIADGAALDRLYRRLDSLDWGLGEDGQRVPVTLPLDEAAADLFEEWIRANNASLEDHSAIYQGMVGKMRGGVLRLALVSELVCWAWSGGHEPRSISVQSIARAAEFVDTYAKPSALRVFGDAALPPVERNAAVLGRYIRRIRATRINARDLKRSPHKQSLPGMRDAAALNESLEALCDAGWLRKDGHRAGEGPGRVSSDYAVNPMVVGEG